MLDCCSAAGRSFRPPKMLGQNCLVFLPGPKVCFVLEAVTQFHARVKRVGDGTGLLCCCVLASAVQHNPSSSSAYGRTSTSWRLLTSSGCGHAGSAECVKNHEGCQGAELVLIKIEMCLWLLTEGSRLFFIRIGRAESLSVYSFNIGIRYHFSIF